MTTLRPTTLLASLLGLDIALLIVAAALTPQQSPMLPIEISLLLAVLAAWVLIRRSRSSAGTCAVACLALVALTVHILLGDLGTAGPRELVPDVLLLISFAGSTVVAALATRARPARAIA